MQEVFKLLLGTVNNVDKEDKSQRTPLLKAAKRASTEAVKSLLEAGADINVLIYTPPHVTASINRNTKVAELIILKNADVNTRNVKHPSRVESDVEDIIISHGGG